MNDPMTLAEAIRVYEESHLQSDRFSQEELTAAYALGLSGLYALQAMGDLRRENKAARDIFGKSYEYREKYNRYKEDKKKQEKMRMNIK